jgi:dihydroorotase
VHAMNLIYNETEVLGFDSNFKVMPPLRRESDRIALWNGVNDGTIDTIVSDHRPHDKEEKDVEFDNASFGCINLQTVFASLGNCKEFELQKIINCLTQKSRSILAIPSCPIEVGQKADLTLFTPDEKWIFEKDTIVSNTFNSPFIGHELTGDVVGVLNNGKLALKAD